MSESVRPNFLDRVIESLAPGLGMRRASARLRLETMRNVTARYEGASRTHRSSRVAVGSHSADGAIGRSLSRLRDTSRDMDRNNAYAHRAFTVIPTNVVGAGIVPSVECDKPQLKKRIQALVKRHLDTTDIDFDGRSTLSGLQYIAMRTVARDGEVLILRKFPPSSAKLKVPLQLRILECDYLDSLQDGPITGGGFCVQGVEFDSNGRRVAYHLHVDHPGSQRVHLPRRSETRRVLAEDVIHIYRQDRPGQTRGVPWIAPAMVTLWDLKDYEEAELVRQRVAACFAAFVHGSGSENLGQSMQGKTDRQGRGIDIMSPGTIQHLAQSETVTFATPPQVQGYPDFVRMCLRKVASAFGIPFNELASDDSQENFASSRRGYLVFQRLIETWRWQMFIPQALDRIGLWFLEACTIPLRGTPDARIGWTPPRRELINPKEEVAVMRDLIRSGLSTRSEQNRSLGNDPEEIEAEAAEDNARADAKGLLFDSDARNPIKGPAATLPPEQAEANV